MFLLDTNIVIDIIRGRSSTVADRLKREIALSTDIALPAPVFFELHYGIQKSDRSALNLARLDHFMRAIPTILPFDAADAEESGAIRADLERRGEPIGAYDILIAAQARRRNATLVTRNLKEFRRVIGLWVTDWG